MTLRIWSRVSPRNGPPLAVRINRSTLRAAPPRRHWASAECSESTATICPGWAAWVTSGPPTTRDSLLAKARIRPARRAASVAASPVDPVIPLSTASHGIAATSAAASGPATMRGSRTSPTAQPRRLASAYSASWRSWTVVARLTATICAALSNTCRANSAICEPPAAKPTTRN